MARSARFSPTSGTRGGAAPPPHPRSAASSDLEADLADGALGIGLLVSYAPGATPEEYLRVAALAAASGVPTFTHSRDLIEFTPDGAIDGAEEIVRAAGETGAHMHYCHVNSTTIRHADRVLGLIERAQQAGAQVSTEAYPYGAGMTGIGAAFLAPERLVERGLTPRSIIYAPTGEEVASAARLTELRAADPGGLAIIRQLDEEDPNDQAVLLRYLTFPGSVIASDAMPLTWIGAPPEPAAGHCRRRRSLIQGRRARTRARSGRSRRNGGLSLPEILAKCSLHPAMLLQERVPAMRRKGRLSEGSDADIVVFDPETITDQATYSAAPGLDRHPARARQRHLRRPRRQARPRRSARPPRPRLTC